MHIEIDQGIVTVRGATVSSVTPAHYPREPSEIPQLWPDFPVHAMNGRFVLKGTLLGRVHSLRIESRGIDVTRNRLQGLANGSALLTSLEFRS